MEASHEELLTLYSCPVWSPLLRVHLGYLETARFIDVLNIDSLFSFLGIEEEAALLINDEVRA